MELVYLALRVAFLIAMSIAFCGWTVVLGSAPLFVLQASEGRWPFMVGVVIAGGFLIGFGAYGFAIPFLLSAFLTYIFLELLEMGVTFLKSAVMSLSLVSGASLLTLTAVARAHGQTAAELLNTQLTRFVLELQSVHPEIKFDVESLLVQLPSAVAIMMAISIWIGVLFGKRFASASSKSALMRVKLRQFDLPVGLVWVLVFSLAGRFLLPEMTLAQLVALNIFNIVVFAYFLKGLALVATYMHVYRVGTVWRGMLYILLVAQLFLAVAILGVMDIWLNWRPKILKNAAQEPMER